MKVTPSIEDLRQLARRKTLFRLELEQGIASAQRALGLFRTQRTPLKKAFRKEKARLLKVQNRAGLTDARREASKAYRALQKVTAQIAGTQPTTVEGALALAQYVERRLWCGDPVLFSDDGNMPGHFGRLLRCANNLLAGAVAPKGEQNKSRN